MQLSIPQPAALAARPSPSYSLARPVGWWDVLFATVQKELRIARKYKANLIGTLVYVGNGKHPPQWVSKVLQSRDRAKAAPTFGPEGLYLERIEYERKWGLPI